MTWGQLLRVGVELALDLVRDRMKEAQDAEAPGLPYAHVRRQQEQAAAAVAHKVAPKGKP